MPIPIFPLNKLICAKQHKTTQHAHIISEV